MSDQIMQKLDEMQALTYSSSVPLGVSVARHADLLLLETRRDLRKAVTALRIVVEQPEMDDDGMYHACEACDGNHVRIDQRAIAEALGVDDD